MSCGPCFVVILGQKYGFRPIPPVIKQKDFEKIVSYIERLAESDPKEEEGLQLIRKWFKLDQNEIGECAAQSFKTALNLNRRVQCHSMQFFVGKHRMVCM